MKGNTPFSRPRIQSGGASFTPACGPLLSPSRAWRILRQRTGSRLARSTFYRWLESGRAYSLRIGTRIYVPWQELDEIIRKCLNGESL